MSPARSGRGWCRRPRPAGACGSLVAAAASAAMIASVIGYGPRGSSAFVPRGLSSSSSSPPPASCSPGRLQPRPPRPWPALLAHDHEREHHHDHDHGDPVPLILLAGPPAPTTATMDALQAILEEHQQRHQDPGKQPLGVVLAAGTGGVSDRLLALQEAQTSSCGDEGCFVLYSLKHVEPGTEAAASRIRQAAIELIEEQGPFAAVLLVVPPSLDVLAAAEVLTGHGHGHEEEDGDCDDNDDDHHQHHYHDGCEHCGAPSIARLQRVLAAVDVSSFLTEWQRADGLAERGLLLAAGQENEDGEEEDYRTVADVLCSQIETADTLVVTGGGQQQQQASVVASVLRRLKPSARVLSLGSDREAIYASVATPPHAGGPGFDVHEAENGAGWLQLLNSNSNEGDAADDEDTWATVYRRRRPFHPRRLWDFVTRAGGPMESVLRSKGFFWLASRHNGMGLWGQAGGSFAPEAAGAWWCVTPQDEWPDEDEEDVRADFDADGGPYGDRRQEIAFVGLQRSGGGKKDLLAGLDACLLTDEEIGSGPEAWEEFEDPFPDW